MQIPLDIIGQIALNLPFTDVLHLSAVSRHYRQLLNKDSFWRAKTTLDYPTREHPELSPDMWRTHYYRLAAGTIANTPSIEEPHIQQVIDSYEFHGPSQNLSDDEYSRCHAWQNKLILRRKLRAKALLSSIGMEKIRQLPPRQLPIESFAGEFDEVLDIRLLDITHFPGDLVGIVVPLDDPDYPVEDSEDLENEDVGNEDLENEDLENEDDTRQRTPLELGGRRIFIYAKDHGYYDIGLEELPQSFILDKMNDGYGVAEIQSIYESFV